MFNEEQLTLQGLRLSLGNDRAVQRILQEDEPLNAHGAF